MIPVQNGKEDVNARTKQLCEVAAGLRAAGRGKESLRVLEEAHKLDPSSAQVIEALNQLKLVDEQEIAPGSLLAACKDLVVEPDSSDVAGTILRIASEGKYDAKEAEKSLEALFQVANDHITKNKAILRIISTISGQHAIATLLKANATESFQHLWNCGNAVVSSLISTVITPIAWDAERDRESAEKGVFQLLLARLLEPAQEAAEMAMRAMARLLAGCTSDFEPFVDASNFEIILSMLNVQLPAALRSQATLVTAKFLEFSPDKGQRLLTEYVVTRARRPTVDDLVDAFSVAASIFPVLPATAAPLFLTPGFLDDLTSVTRKSNSARLGRAALELLSAACVDKACREAIAEKCTAWLQEIVDKKSDDKAAGAVYGAMAALILCKIQAVPAKHGSPIDMVKLATYLRIVLMTTDDDAINQIAIEGIAYASVRGLVKHSLAKDTVFMKKLIDILQTHKSQRGLLFGGLTTISNLTAFRPEESAEQQKISQLKAYANQSKEEQKDIYNDDEEVDVRCRIVIEVGTIPLLNTAVKQATPTVLSLVSNIAFSLTKQPKHRGLLVQQGLLDTLLRLSNLSTSDDAILNTVRSQSAHALARVLISLDPALIFSTPANRTVESAIRPLSILITPADVPSSSTLTAPAASVSNAAIFDALRALTNLASFSENARQIITYLSFAHIESYLWSRVSALAQAAMECILNLTQSPAAAQMFFSVDEADLGSQNTSSVPSSPVASDNTDASTALKNDKTAARTRLTLVLALTNSSTRGTALAAAAALSQILAFEAGATSFLALPTTTSQSVVAVATETVSNKALEDRTPIRRLLTLVADSAGIAASSTAHPDSGSTAEAQLDPDMLARAATATCAFIDAGGSAVRTSVRDAGGLRLLEALVNMTVVEQMSLSDMISDAIAALKDSTES